MEIVSVADTVWGISGRGLAGAGGEVGDNWDVEEGTFGVEGERRARVGAGEKGERSERRWVEGLEEVGEGEGPRGVTWVTAPPS